MNLSPEVITAIQKMERIAKVQFCGAGYLDEDHSVYARHHEGEPEDIVWTRSSAGMPDHILALNGLHLENLAQTLYNFCRISWAERGLIMVEWYGGSAYPGGST